MIEPLDIEKEYEGYVAKCYPFGCGEVQRTEMKRVFYAGIHLLLCHMLTFNEAEAGDKELERLLSETQNFAKKVAQTQRNN